MQAQNYLEGLRERLTPLFTPPKVKGGHDATHPMRLESMYRLMAKHIPGVDEDEYIATVWLHNMDRATEFDAVAKALEMSLSEIVKGQLADSPFNEDARARVIDAVLQHPKKDDSPNDSPLLQALRLADKWDRLGPNGIFCGAAMRGGFLMPYDPAKPFGYGTTVDGKMRTLWEDYFRILEWFPQFGLIRQLCWDERCRKINFFISFIRSWGAEIAERHGIPDETEADIKKALGSFYPDFALR